MKLMMVSALIMMIMMTVAMMTTMSLLMHTIEACSWFLQGSTRFEKEGDNKAAYISWADGSWLISADGFGKVQPMPFLSGL
jgi:hypothetical protein